MAKSDAAPRLRSDVEEDRLYRSDWLTDKESIQISDMIPMPQRLVLCSPCAGLVDWLQYTDPDNRGMEPEATRAMMMDLALEDHISRTGREELTPAELARYRGKIQKMLDDLTRQDARRAGVSDARVFDLVNDSL